MTATPCIDSSTHPTNNPTPIRPKAGISTLLSPGPAATASFLLIAHGMIQAQEPIYLNQGDDFASVVAAAAPGSRFVIRAGIHRGHNILAKEGMTFSGEPGAILSGAAILSNWRFEDPYWVCDESIPRLPSDFDLNALCLSPACPYPQDLYRDGRALTHVLYKQQLTGAEQWHFDYAAGKIYIRFDPSPHRIELSGLGHFAILPESTPAGLAADVTVRDLIVEKFATLGISCAIAVGDGGLIENVEARWNHSVGLAASALNTRAVVRRCYCHHNGQNGFLGGGILTIENNEFSYNGWAGYSGAWSIGGMKCARTHDMLVRRNYSHHNIGPGFWTDIFSLNTVYEENIAERNTWEGFLIEISCGATVRRNFARWNGTNPGPARSQLWAAQICVQNAKGVEIANNYCECSGQRQLGHNQNGIVLINQDVRGMGECGWANVEQCYVHDNTIVMPAGARNGLCWGTLGWNTYADFLAANNRWERTRYLTGDYFATRWWWMIPGPSGQVSEGFDFGWETWRSLQLDDDGSLETRHRSDLSDFRGNLMGLANSTTGLDYDSVLASARRAPPRDDDGDSLEDDWEWQVGLDPTRPDAEEDRDGDGLTNLEEFGAKTNPFSADSDLDDLSDFLEVSEQLQPTLPISPASDTDQDGLSDKEEWEAGLDARKADLLLGPLPLASLQLWLDSVDGPVIENGTLLRWDDRSGNQHHAIAISNQPAPLHTDPNSGRLFWENPNRALGTINGSLLSPGASGFVMIAVLQVNEPSTDDHLVRGLLSTEVYLVAGFRMGIQDGVPIFWSTQNAGTLWMRGFDRFAINHTHVVTLAYSSDTHRAQLSVDGVEWGRAAGTIQLTGAPLGMFIGGISGANWRQSSFSDVMFFDRALTLIERRRAEAMLLAKFLRKGPLVRDSDQNGREDWLDVRDFPAQPPPRGTADLTPAEIEHRFVEAGHLPLGPVLDSDGDGLDDTWELLHGLLVGIDDSQNDSDGDGITAFGEHVLVLDPRITDGVPAIEIRMGEPGSFLQARFVLERAMLTKAQVLLESSADLRPDGWTPSRQNVESITILDAHRAEVAVKLLDPLSLRPKSFLRLRLIPRPSS